MTKSRRSSPTPPRSETDRDAAALGADHPATAKLSFLAFMESLCFDWLDLTRERDTGRDVNL